MYICLTYNKICKQDLEIQQSLLEIIDTFNYFTQNKDLLSLN